MSFQFNLETLPNLTFRELRQVWEESGFSGPPASLKRILVRELAWRLQARACGGMDPKTRRLLKAAIRDSRVNGESPSRKSKTRKKRARAVQLRTGTKLLRKWRGKTHEVEVLEDGKRFLYLGKEYASLTKIAEEITGAHWSGPRFFGLDKRREKS